MQGIKGTKFQEGKTVLTLMLKGKYLSPLSLAKTSGQPDSGKIY